MRKRCLGKASEEGKERENSVVEVIRSEWRSDGE